MDFEYTDTQKAIQAVAREFAQKEVAPGAEERDRTGEFPYELFRKAAVEMGFTRIIFPEKYGGLGGDYLSLCLVEEEIGRWDCSFSASVFTGIGTARLLTHCGTGEQIRKWALPLIQGSSTASLGFTEPNGGSDLAGGIQTKAVRRDGEWVINGAKAFITNSGTDISIFCVVLAVTGKQGDGKKETSLFLVPNGTEGFTVMPNYRKLGWRSSDTHELVFEDCRVPDSNLVGELGSGLPQALGVLSQFGAFSLSSNAIGLARGCLDESLDHAKNRVAFGKPISKFQHVQNMLVEMAVGIEISTLLRNKLVWQWDAQGQGSRKLNYIMKYYCCEAAKRAADMAVQVFGGMGFMDECPVSRYYRDCRVLTIGDGTSEIHKYNIAKELGC